MSQIPFTPPGKPEYVWEIATLYPEQGCWTEKEYLELTDSANRHIEYTDGRLEFLPMPTEVHEALVQFLYFALYAFVNQQELGKVYSNGVRVRVRPGKYRLPDIVFLHKDHFEVRHNRAWDGADLVMEVASDDPHDRQRDFEQKLIDYAESGIAEYWIVDLEVRKVIVHSLDHREYAVCGEYTPGRCATSLLLEGFEIDVAALFAAADEVPE